MFQSPQAARNLLNMSSDPGMSRTSALETENAFDNGPASKVAANTQPFNNERMAVQSSLQSTTSAANQANANARQEVNKMGLVQDNQNFKANKFMTDRKEIMMEVLGSPATEMIGRQNEVERTQFRHDIATGKAMAMGVNPDLAQYQTSTQDYA